MNVPEFKNIELPMLAVFVNNEVLSLHDRLDVNSKVVPIFADSSVGSFVYRRTVTFLLCMAAANIFPERRLVVSHTMGHSLLFYFHGMELISEEEVRSLKIEMQRIISLNAPILRSVFSYEDALKYFKTQTNTYELIRSSNDARVFVNTCLGFSSLWTCSLCPSTGCISHFDLSCYGHGLLVHYPSTRSPSKLSEFEDNPLLYQRYREHRLWARNINVNCVGELNEILRSEKATKELVMVCETRQQQQLNNICSKITNDHKIVLIAGPSSSGKTTFSLKLSIVLRAMGYVPVTLCMDNYYVNRVDTPLDEDGNYDFEAVEALDVALLNDHIKKLSEGEEIDSPYFNFKAGVREFNGKKLRLPNNGILVMEGLHALNDRLTSLIKPEQKFKVFISPLTQLNIDDHSRIATTDNRLIRRMVRDAQFRGHSADFTFKFWPSVKRGENNHIYPFQNQADAVFNSALTFELPVLKVFAVPLLQQIKPDSPYYGEARRLLAILDKFLPLSQKYIHCTSILREFIGDGYYNYD
eukprot:TRINITY_DN2782_c0_g1_i2.p1 TRINITY_DN2782_c0_g1~~TRINITY_DN2782_c0_g1_i2.p1  ORF type:complete len:561 (+),score=116.04 TRINITY_DN2782_c0_g1_i2:108-1685(+)